jgi:hypothetical protein
MSRAVQRGTPKLAILRILSAERTLHLVSGSRFTNPNHLLHPTMTGPTDPRTNPGGDISDAYAPATFQSAIFAPFLGKSVGVYLDDIIIFSKTAEDIPLKSDRSSRAFGNRSSMRRRRSVRVSTPTLPRSQRSRNGEHQPRWHTCVPSWASPSISGVSSGGTPN